MSKNKIGLIFGLFLAIIHAVWSLAVALMPVALQSFVSWILVLHHIDIPFTIVVPFVLINAIILVAVTFVCGYLGGYILGALHELVMKKKV